MKPETILATLASELDYLKKEEWFIEATKELNVQTVLYAIREVVSHSINGTLQQLAKSAYKYFDNGGHDRMAFCVIMETHDIGEYVFENIWKHISNRALNGLPLTLIEDTPDMWEEQSPNVLTHKRAKGIVLRLIDGSTVMHTGVTYLTPGKFGTGWVGRVETPVPVTFPCLVDIKIKNIYTTVLGEVIGELQADSYLESIFLDMVINHCLFCSNLPLDERGIEFNGVQLASGVEKFFSEFCVEEDSFKWKLKSRKVLLSLIREYLETYDILEDIEPIMIAMTIYRAVEKCDYILAVRGINAKNRIQGICVNTDSLSATHAIGNFRKDPDVEWYGNNILARTIKVLNAQ